MTPQQHQAIVDELTELLNGWLTDAKLENERVAQEDSRAFGRADAYNRMRIELERRIKHHRGRAAVTA